MITSSNSSNTHIVVAEIHRNPESDTNDDQIAGVVNDKVAHTIETKGKINEIINKVGDDTNFKKNINLDNVIYSGNEPDITLLSDEKSETVVKDMSASNQYKLKTISDFISLEPILITGTPLNDIKSQKTRPVSNSFSTKIKEWFESRFDNVMDFCKKIKSFFKGL